MTEIETTKLHEILGGLAKWNHDAWIKAAFAVFELDRDVIEVASRKLGVSHNSAAFTDRIADFRQFPPSVMLGMIDLVRWEMAVRDRVARETSPKDSN